MLQPSVTCPFARIATGAERHSLRQGESIDGWTIEMIEGASVKVARDGETKILQIFGSKREHDLAPDERQSMTTIQVV